MGLLTSVMVLMKSHWIYLVGDFFSPLDLDFDLFKMLLLNMFCIFRQHKNTNPVSCAEVLFWPHHTRGYTLSDPFDVLDFADN